MKRSAEITGLTVISIADGRETGRVKDLVINAQQGTVECLIIDRENTYLELKVIPFAAVEGIGEDAVTIANEDAILNATEVPGLEELLRQNIRIKGTRVMTRKGKMMGSVSEYFVDEESGKIIACEFTPVNGNGENKIIPASAIVTFGKDVLVVAENVENEILDSLAELENGPSGIETSSTSEQINPSDAARLFEERQRQFLLGKRATKTIESDSGEVIVAEGEVITEEIIERAKKEGKIMELTMNISS